MNRIFPEIAPWVLVFCSLALASWGNAQDFDGKASAKDLATLKGRPFSMQLRTGLIIDEAQFVSIVTDPRSGGIKFIEYQKGKRSTKAKVEDIYRMMIDGRPFHSRYHGPTRTHHLINEMVANEQVDKRIAGLNRRRTESQTPEALKQQNIELLGFVQDGVRRMGNPQLRIEETEFAILVTDYPELQTKVFSQLMPAVFRHMNHVFGVPANETLLPGKAIIAYFQQRENFQTFERVVMENPNFGTSVGIVHSNSKRFVGVTHDTTFDISSIRGVCWTVSAGYLGRFYSNVPLPEWFAAGMPGALADGSIPRDEKTNRRETEAVINQLKRDGSLNGILDATDLDRDRKSLAKLLVQFLMRRDLLATTQFLQDLKAGHDPAVALMLNHGLNQESLAFEFGRALGVPNVRP